MKATIHIGNCIYVMKAMPESSIDAIVTDPPYHLTTGKKGGSGEASVNLESPYGRARITTGFMGMKWDGGDIAHSVETWQACLRVLKPGGHLLSFGGTRTYHRMVCAIEDAGFEIRDNISYYYSSDVDRNTFLDSLSLEQQEEFLKAFGRPSSLDWTYGSGFPKSLDVSKAIDRAGGRAENWFGPWLRGERERIGMTAVKLAELGGFYENVNHGGRVVNWELGYSLPSAKEFNKVCEILNLQFERLEEVERQVIGQRKVNKGLAFTSDGAEVLDITLPATDVAKRFSGWGTALKPAHEPIVVARKPLEGTVAANVLKWGTGAINVDGCRVGTESTIGPRSGNSFGLINDDGWEPKPGMNGSECGRWPANVILDGSEEVVSLFPEVDSVASMRGVGFNDSNVFGKGNQDYDALRGFNDSGSAARFFYCPKVDRDERNKGCYDMDEKPLNWSSGTQSPGTFQAEGTNRASQNNHPTVKPVDLMAYLCRLVTPPGGVVLDPFLGSGSTGIAALRENFDFIGVEISPDYATIAEKRIKGSLPWFQADAVTVVGRIEEPIPAEEGSLFA